MSEKLEYAKLDSSKECPFPVRESLRKDIYMFRGVLSRIQNKTNGLEIVERSHDLCGVGLYQ